MTLGNILSLENKDDCVQKFERYFDISATVEAFIAEESGENAEMGEVRVWSVFHLLQVISILKQMEFSLI